MYDPWRKVGRVETDDIMKPWPFHPLAKPNYGDMGEKYLPFPSREIQAVISYDDSDPKVTDIYNPGVGIYPWADDADFAFPSVFGHFPQPGGGKTFEDYKKYKGPNPDAQGRYRNDGDLDIQMAVSCDGIHWIGWIAVLISNWGRTEVPIANSCSSCRDGSAEAAKSTSIISRRTIPTENSGGSNGLGIWGAVMRVVQRLDGFVSVDTDYHGGEPHHALGNLSGPSPGAKPERRHPPEKRAWKWKMRRGNRSKDTQRKTAMKW